MDKPKDDAPLDGAIFLEQLDAALDGKKSAGEHSDVAAFGADLKNVLNSSEDEMDPAAPESLRRTLNLKVPKAPSSVVKLDKKLARFRLGLLDIAALVGVAVLGFLIWNALKTPAPTAKKDPEPVPIKKENTFAAEDGNVPPKNGDMPVAPKDKETTGAQKEEELWRAEINKKLSRKISFDFVDTPLEEALAFFRPLAKVNLILDPAVAAEGLHKTPLTLRVQDMETGIALRWTLRLANLDYDIRNHVVFITHSETLANTNELRTYDIRQLPFSEGSLITLLNSLNLDPNFGVGGAEIKALNGTLSVVQNSKNHRLITHTLNVIQKMSATGIVDLPFATGSEAVRNELPDEINLNPLPEWKVAIREKLQRKVTLEFIDTPLEDAVSNLRSIANVTIIIDPKVIAKGSPTINLRVTDMSVDLALDWVTRLADLNYVLRDNAIFISKNQAQVRKVVAYKPVHFEKNVKLSIKDMASEIRSKIHPNSWDAQGVSIEELDGWLLVRQSKDVHRDIQNWLTGKVKSPGQQLEF